ncbi:MAG: hypothetical protein KIS81_09925 [Maricaulaceae bacterium]|nr:hypothetical protein [Maricaulaceae bacterium]
MNTALSTAAAILLSVSGAAAAQQPASPLAPLFECRALTDPMARLACQDAAIEALLESESAGEVVAVTREDIDRDQESRFGFGISLPRFGAPRLPRGSGEAIRETAGSAGSRVERREDGSIGRIEGLVVASWRRDPHGKFVIALENGQVWRQAEGSRIRIYGSDQPGQMTVTIRTGMFNSYLMQVNGRGEWFGVLRTN